MIRYLIISLINTGAHLKELIKSHLVKILIELYFIPEL